MAHVSVTIAGRVYRMACGDGEEPRLEALAAQVDAKIAELRVAFGEIGDQRITVMAALTFADELLEAHRRLEALEGDIAALKTAALADRARHDRSVASLAASLEEAASRLERVAGDLGAAG